MKYFPLLLYYYLHVAYNNFLGDIGGSEVKACASNVGDLGLIPGSGRYPREGK